MMKNRELLEVQNSVLSITVGLVFAADYFFNGTLYERFPDTYRYMRFVPSLVWGVIFVSAGLIHLATLFATRYYGIRKHILLTKSGLWMFLGWCVVSADLYAAFGWSSFVFAAFAVISFFRFTYPKEMTPDVPHRPTHQQTLA